MFGYTKVAEFMECSGAQYPPLEEMKRDIDSETKEILLAYMKNGWHFGEAPAILKDVFTGESLHMPLSYLCDGKYCWRSDVPYYMEHYGLVPEKEFVDYVIEKAKSEGMHSSSGVGLMKVMLKKTTAFIKGKVYEVMSIERGWYRIMTELDEDYLFPPKLFDIVEGSPDMYVDTYAK